MRGDMERHDTTFFDIYVSRRNRAKRHDMTHTPLGVCRAVSRSMG